MAARRTKTNSAGKRAASRKRARTAPKQTRTLLLRDVEGDVIEILRARAERAGRSLQQELHLSLRRDARRNFEEARAITDAWRARLAGRELPDSASLIREDRDR